MYLAKSHCQTLFILYHHSMAFEVSLLTLLISLILHPTSTGLLILLILEQAKHSCLRVPAFPGHFARNALAERLEGLTSFRPVCRGFAHPLTFAPPSPHLSSSSVLSCFIFLQSTSSPFAILSITCSSFCLCQYPVICVRAGNLSGLFTV